MEPVEENDIDIAFSTQNLIIVNSTNETLKDPLWKDVVVKEAWKVWKGWT